MKKNDIISENIFCMKYYSEIVFLCDLLLFLSFDLDTDLLFFRLLFFILYL